MYAFQLLNSIEQLEKSYINDGINVNSVFRIMSPGGMYVDLTEIEITLSSIVFKFEYKNCCGIGSIYVKEILNKARYKNIKICGFKNHLDTIRYLVYNPASKNILLSNGNLFHSTIKLNNTF